MKEGKQGVRERSWREGRRGWKTAKTNRRKTDGGRNVGSWRMGVVSELILMLSMSRSHAGCARWRCFLFHRLLGFPWTRDKHGTELWWFSLVFCFFFPLAHPFFFLIPISYLISSFSSYFCMYVRNYLISLYIAIHLSIFFVHLYVYMYSSILTYFHTVLHLEIIIKKDLWKLKTHFLSHNVALAAWLPVAGALSGTCCLRSSSADFPPGDNEMFVSKIPWYIMLG